MTRDERDRKFAEALVELQEHGQIHPNLLTELKAIRDGEL